MSSSHDDDGTVRLCCVEDPRMRELSGRCG